jgi:hypothetical protein
MENLADVLQSVASKNFSAPIQGQKLLLYSSQQSNGVFNWEVAQSCVDNIKDNNGNSVYYRLDDTAGGKYLADVQLNDGSTFNLYTELGVKLFNQKMGDQTAAQQLFEAASKATIQNASGDIVALTGGTATVTGTGDVIMASSDTVNIVGANSSSPSQQHN